MSAAQLATLLSAVHAYNDQYAANGNSCYWYTYTVMEVIRTKFVAVQTEGSAFAERSMFARKKMGVEGDVEAVSKLYDTEWAKCAEQAQKRVVSTVNWYFANFGESDVSQDSIRVNEENANAAGAAHKDRMAKIEAEEGRKQAEAGRKQAEQELEREAIRRKQEEDRRKQAEVEREREKRRAEREKERAEREKERAERLEAELRALRENHGVRN